jgi:hypothetical protein
MSASLPQHCKAISSFDALHWDQLSVAQGDQLTVVARRQHWWLVLRGKEVGRVPSIHVQLVSGVARVASIQAADAAIGLVLPRSVLECYVFPFLVAMEGARHAACIAQLCLRCRALVHEPAFWTFYGARHRGHYIKQRAPHAGLWQEYMLHHYLFAAPMLLNLGVFAFLESKVLRRYAGHGYNAASWRWLCTRVSPNCVKEGLFDAYNLLKGVIYRRGRANCAFSRSWIASDGTIDVAWSSGMRYYGSCLWWVHQQERFLLFLWLDVNASQGEDLAQATLSLLCIAGHFDSC